MTDNNTNKTRSEAKENTSRSASKQKKGGASVLLIVVLVIVLVAAGLAAGFFFGKNYSKPASPAIQVDNVAAVPITGTSEDAADGEDEGNNVTALQELQGTVPEQQDTVSALQGDFTFGAGTTAEDDNIVVAEYTNGKLYRSDVAEEYNSQLSAALFAGYNESDVSGRLLQDTMESMIRSRVIEAKAKELGFTELSAEEKAKAEQEASTNYAEQVAFYIDFVHEDGMTDEEATAEAEKFLNEYEGITLEGLYDYTVRDIWANKLYAEVTKSVDVTDEDVRAAYDDLLSVQQSSYPESAESFELDQLNGSAIVYYPAGYRAVKIMNFYIDDASMLQRIQLQDELSTLNESTDSARIAEINAQLESAYTVCTENAQKALDELKSGASFDDVYLKYSENQAYTADSVKKTGNFISASSVLYDSATISAAMALANPGDVSDIIRVEGGVCIIKYLGELTPGAVDFESVREDIRAEVLTRAKENAYETKCSEWVAEVNPVYYPERMY